MVASTGASLCAVKACSRARVSGGYSIPRSLYLSIPSPMMWGATVQIAPQIAGRAAVEIAGLAT